MMEHIENNHWSKCKKETWQKLFKLGKNIQAKSLQELFDQQKNRSQLFNIAAGPIQIDYSKNFISTEILHELFRFAQASDLEQATISLLQGLPFSDCSLNFTENRPALHTLLREKSSSQQEWQEVNQTLAQISQIVTKIQQQQWLPYQNTPIDIVHIGIGGSEIGPRLVTEALKPYHNNCCRIHFIANLDQAEIQQLLTTLRPSNTLFILCSKTFTTLETLNNGNIAKQWLVSQGINNIVPHFLAVTMNLDAAMTFGVAKENCLPLWPWVGGRYSLWSAVGICIALATNMECFVDLLAGAQCIDTHFQTEPIDSNAPVILALLTVWYRNILNYQNHAIIPYDHLLTKLPTYLQQLVMESNGKHTDRWNEEIKYHSSPLIWGGVGSNSQHTFNQWLLQGTSNSSIDFILPFESHYCDAVNHRQTMVSNCLAQIQALTFGTTLAQSQQQAIEKGFQPEAANKLAPHLQVTGNQPSNLIYFKKTTPKTLGALLALYEHKTFVEAILWDINCFDQWGVELGKTICQDIRQQFAATKPNLSKPQEQLFKPIFQQVIAWQKESK